jgi:SAM-dependent methyltransferase
MDTRDHWRALIRPTGLDDLDQVGHPDMGRAFNRHAYEVRLRGVVKSLEIAGCNLTQCSIFEAAYGVGFYLQYWHRLGCKNVVGVDISDSACQLVRSIFPEYDLRVGDLLEIEDWKDWHNLRASFQLVTAIDVLYHIVDDSAASKAVRILADLVAPDGIFLFTDKVWGLRQPQRETPFVQRRPLDWYNKILGEEGFCLYSQVPLMWCTDPPTPYSRFSFSWALARLMWLSMRPLKFLPRNSAFQNVLGSIAGSIGRMIDFTALRWLKTVPNLTVFAYKRCT